MFNKCKTIVSICTLPLFFTACSITSSNIEQIETKVKTKKKDFINLGKPLASSKFNVYINSSDELKYLCYNNSLNCNYYDSLKHDYLNGKPLEESFTIYPKLYNPHINIDTKGIQCGVGSFGGWLSVFTGIENHNKKNPKICNSRFTKLDSTQFSNRFFVGLLTFMTPFATAGTMHTRKIDVDSLKESIHMSNINSFKNKLFYLSKKYDIDGGLDIIYLEKDEIKNNLEDKYLYLLNDKSKKEGVIFLEKDSNRLLSINIFKKFKDVNLMKSISLQINDLFNNIMNNDNNVLKYNDIVSYIPREIELPILPKAKHLIKSEYEKKSEFEQRVKKNVEKREKEIRALQKQYSLDVYERNVYIENLEKAYINYLENTYKNKNVLVEELNKNISILSKVLFLENISGYSASDFKYDAESERLYFKIASRNGLFSQKVLSKMPANSAREIKENAAFKIIPIINSKDNKILLRGFNILDTKLDKTYKVEYTNINFKNEIVSLVVKNIKKEIKKDVSKEFKQYKQKTKSIVDLSKKEVWYIDVVNSLNAKVPAWFEDTSVNKIIGYGYGDNLLDAKAMARKDLSSMVKVKVNTSFESIKNIDNIKNFKQIKQKTKQSSNIVLNKSNYKVLRKQKLDSKWYVALEYLD